jgi:hypothetical protein
MRGFVCSDCRNHFFQDPKCISCGAQKLYDSTVKGQGEVIEKYSEYIERLEEALRNLSFAALARENVYDPCSLLDVKYKLDDARKHADALLREKK